ncbi:MAG: GTP cyclohydrolase FolE2 [Xanthomonadaceae bacterium]|jgi:GTP cyclohydrolase I|nr:GTP cyclohydrolase FolE2 [Xanthomonadaceae bacterium]
MVLIPDNRMTLNEHSTSRGAVLPDVAHQSVSLARTLDWVGMEHIALPVRVDDGMSESTLVDASVDLFVNLVRPAERGIHMSRLYLRLQEVLANRTIEPAGLRGVLQACVESQGALSSAARIKLRYNALLQRKALESGNKGWKRYPIEIDAVLNGGNMQLTLGLSVEYSSTCPASAALSRQVTAERFAERFADASVSAAAVRDWLASEQGMAATPHAQRSRAQVYLKLLPDVKTLPLSGLIDALEAVLGTPVQTAVKREDEQAFARLNAQNLMFCEDAARRVASVLAAEPATEYFEATVSHYESLHPHDAVARVSGAGPAAMPRVG